MSGSAELVEFLLNSIDEDEQRARVCADAFPGPWELADRGYEAYVTADRPHFLRVAQITQEQSTQDWPGEHLEHIASHDPDRVLRECKAKRDVVRMYQFQESQEHEHNAIAAMGLRQALRAIAAVYADRPGYDARWVDG